MKIQKSPKFYDMYRDGITSSMIAKWLTCPKQCEIEYAKGYASHKQSDAITYGNCVHSVLQQAYSQSTIPLPGLIRTYINRYSERIQDDEASSEQQEANEISYAKAEGVLRYYFVHYQKDFDTTWVITEDTYRVDVGYKDGKVVPLRGKLDGGFKKNEDSALWLVDHKCMGQIVLDDILLLLPVDLQINFYLWCMVANGQDPKGFYYNIIRNPQLKPHRSKGESLEGFTERIAEKVAEDPKHYFFRIKIPFTREEILNWGKKQLMPILRDMRRWYDSGYKWPEYYNPIALRTRYGLSDMAQAIVEGDYSYYYKKSKPHEELDGD